MPGYPIDLITVDPNDPSRYILGIKCKGATGESGNGIQESHASHLEHQEECKWDARKCNEHF